VKNKLSLALEELHRAENDLAAELLHAADRHRGDHEIFYLARDLARWSQDHVRDIAKIAKGYGVDLDPEPEDDHSLTARLRQRGAELLARRHDASLMLLRDLREIHCKAAGVMLDWQVLGQAAQALRDQELLDLTQRCQKQTERQMRWANGSLKENAAQIMVTP
jgi:hypothetical protein